MESGLENDTHRSNTLNKVNHGFSTNDGSMRKYQNPWDFDDGQV